MAVKIEHRLGVQAPAEVIWRQISEIDRWGEWNPLYPRAEGVVRIGAVLSLDVALPGRPVRAIRPVVADWVPNEQLLWRTRSAAGLITATRYVEIEQLSAAGCIFSNGEMFAGPAARLMNRGARAALRAGFAAMGEAVKARAEAAWRDGGGDPR